MQEKGLEDIVVGRDGRLSGPDLVEGLSRGLRKAGRNVINIGLAPTPVVYFGAFHLNTGRCISVTGSHNPPDHKGFKVVVAGNTRHGDALTELQSLGTTYRRHDAPSHGGHSQRDIHSDHVTLIPHHHPLARTMHVDNADGNWNRI